MQKYQSHKVVEAAIIQNVGELNQDYHHRKLAIKNEADGSDVIKVSEEWYKKHSNNGELDLVGGYYVKYPDGYASWSPADAFEDGYMHLPDSVEDVLGDNFTFGAAVMMLQEGKRVARHGWNGADMYLELQVPDEHSKMQRPYIYMKPVDGKLVPWVASQSDILSEDWYIVK